MPKLPSKVANRPVHSYLRSLSLARKEIVDQVWVDGIDDRALTTRYLEEVSGSEMSEFDIGIPELEAITESESATQSLANYLRMIRDPGPYSIPGGEPVIGVNPYLPRIVPPALEPSLNPGPSPSAPIAERVFPAEHHLETIAIANPGQSPNQPIGSGVYISRNVALTATHVIGREIGKQEVKELLAVEGSTFGDPWHLSPISEAISVGSRDGDEVDLALLFLSSKNMGYSAQLASRSEIEAASAWWVTGFGSSDYRGRQGIGTKRKGMLPITYSKRCSEDETDKYGCTENVHLVAGDLGERVNERVDTCSADSGGPLFVETHSPPDDRVLKLAGITSQGRRYTEILKCGQGGLYVRLDRFHSWIQEKINSVPGALHPVYPT